MTVYALTSYFPLEVRSTDPHLAKLDDISFGAVYLGETDKLPIAIGTAISSSDPVSVLMSNLIQYVIYDETITVDSILEAGDPKNNNFTIINRYEVNDDLSLEFLGSVNTHVHSGSDGRDRLIGSLEVDLMEGGDGRDILKGKAGYDELNGGRGNDRIFGGSDAGIYKGGAGNDILIDDGSSWSEFYGGAGNDKITGGGMLYGGGGRDKLIANHLTADLYGGRGNDILRTGDSAINMDLFGGNGRDKFIIEMKTDSLHVTGGKGADRFVVVAPEHSTSYDVYIKDFEDGKDKFDFSRFGEDFDVSALNIREFRGDHDISYVKRTVEDLFRISFHFSTEDETVVIDHNDFIL
ncbi:calcium-binding protein [Neptunicoccus cionae]|uniref:calcium-binding protein n=1 Tax=Neptunicoccus cionae TaxID=2035344 RepID=UPI000C77407D|nr:calcium-binding protein [Amylibacter cionae]PLS20645.1 hypothetical protein C0U40_16090 [Amylibacter cionae]